MFICTELTERLEIVERFKKSDKSEVEVLEFLNATGRMLDCGVSPVCQMIQEGCDISDIEFIIEQHFKSVSEITLFGNRADAGYHF